MSVVPVDSYVCDRLHVLSYRRGRAEPGVSAAEPAVEARSDEVSLSVCCECGESGSPFEVCASTDTLHSGDHLCMRPGGCHQALG